MYVDLAGLARYKSDFGAWARGKLLPKDAAAARVRTAKAGAVSFVPVQETPLDVSVDFMFTETPPSSGDKSPENPSTISGVSSVKATRCGKNLIPFPDQAVSEEINGVLFTVNQDGSILANGTASADASYVFFRGTSSDRPKHIYYHSNAFTVSGCPSGGSDGTYWVGIQCRNTKGIVVANGKDFGSGYSFSGTYGAYISYCGITIKSGYTASNLLFKPQIEFGSDITEFEKGISNSYIFSLGNTYYGGSIDLATGLMTVTHAVFVYDGTNLTPSTSNFAEYGERYSLQYYFPSIKMAPPGIGDISIYATDILPLNTPDVDSLYIKSNSSGVDIRMLKSDLNLGDGLTRADVVPAYKAWFADHPLTFVYPRSSPLAVQLTPTEILSLTQSSDYDPRVNTVYTDAESVQVGYLKHPSAASADLRNAAVSLGGGV